MLSSKTFHRSKLSQKSISQFICAIQHRLIGTVVTSPAFDDFTVKNEPILSYTKDLKERRAISSNLNLYTTSEPFEVPIIIGGQEYKTKNVQYQRIPHNHGTKLAKFYHATPDLITKAIETSRQAQKEWELVPWAERFKIWLKAADLMASQKWRFKLNATTMLGQSKTVIQAEIDAACELIDFFRFNAYYAKELLKYQPISEVEKVCKNHIRYRGMEGFVAAVSPFNFTAIGGNLSFTPALMGNGVVWKPSDTALLSNYIIFQIMKEAGLPPGIVNFVPADGPTFGNTITNSPYLAGINFTGSVPTFRRLWKQVGDNLAGYVNFPKIVGECGGKNFHFVHPSADIQSVINATIRSAFEYSGQKCSACSRMYVPQSIWPQLKSGLIENMKELKIGPTTDFSVFTSAVIDEVAFKRISGYIDHGKKKHQVLQGGNYDKKTGYYIDPTLIETSDPTDKLMTEEIFGPVLTVYAYPDDKINEMITLVDESTPYALTGAVFAQDEEFLKDALNKLRYSTGNFYINDRSTGSVVGQQPFGGARMSGTNDKAGGPHYVLKWTSPQVIKETYTRTTEWRYSYMDDPQTPLTGLINK